MAEWSRCGALQQRARAVSLATLTLALAVVSTGASRQVDVLGWLVGWRAAGGSAGCWCRLRYRPLEVNLRCSDVLGEYRGSLGSSVQVLCALCVTHRAHPYGLLPIANPNYRIVS